MTKHWRDRLKDDTIAGLLPKGCRDVFEASAGDGELAHMLSQSGLNVTVSNWRLGRVKYPVTEVAADLNDRVPLPDESFDALICREVIEHVESVPHTLREFRRLLRPGGVLVLTFPNRLHLRSRVYHLLTGFYHGMKSPINLSVPLGEAHINLIGYPEMDYFLRHTGFAPFAATTSLIKKADQALRIFLPIIRLATAHYLLRHKPNAEEHSKVKPEDIAYNREIMARITSPELLLGKDVVLAARRGS